MRRKQNSKQEDNLPKYTLGEARLTLARQQTALVFDPKYGGIHEMLIQIETLIGRIRKALVEAAR